MSEAVARLSAALAERYRIERELGQGGMATVYLAEDLRHHRRVALKVLRAELAAVIGADRFLHEITTTANLQHPHILTLHDSGTVDGTVFYVMPFVDGESLRDRLNREKQLPVEDAVRIAREVASALDYAHRHGVIHRDIKPENILLHDGSALVADFGIALAASKTGGNRMTETGMSLGTPHYMSPEQAMGERELDARSDVYALGCVLYEMLSGEPPFTGPTAQAIIARVVTEDPRSLTLQRKTIPPGIEAAVRMALQKLPADRFASAAQFSEALAKRDFTTTMVSAATPLTAEHRTWKGVALGAAAVAVAAISLFAWTWLRPEPARPVARYGLAFPPEQQILDESNPTFALAPDGSFIVYVGPGEGGGQLWIKPRERYDATPLAGTAGARAPSVSPDGAWIAFTAGNAIRKIPTAGGTAITVADSANTLLRTPVTWLDDGTVVFIGRDWNIRRVNAAGGASTVSWQNPAGRFPFFPAALPGARGVVFALCDAACRDVRELWVLDLRSGEAKRLLPEGWWGFHAPTGHLLYTLSDGRLFAARFDLDRLELSGDAVPVLDQVKLDGAVTDLAISRNGTLLMMAGTSIPPGPSQQAVWVGRDGGIAPVDTGWRFDSSRNSGWALSPDGTRMAIGLGSDAGDDIWVKDLVGGQLSRLTFHENEDARPRWSADGRSILFLGRRGDSAISALYSKRADGIGEEELLLRMPTSIWEAVRSPDGKWILTRAGGTSGQTGGRDVFGIQPGIDTSPKPILNGAFDESAAAISPDGRWLAYESNESSRKEIYVRPFPDTESGRWQVSTGGGSHPLWARNGRELFYVSPTRDMIAATIEARPAFSVRERKTLFRIGPDIALTVSYYTTFDISPDGRRFLMLRNIQTERTGQVRMVVVENWFEELKAKVPK